MQFKGKTVSEQRSETPGKSSYYKFKMPTIHITVGEF